MAEHFIATWEAESPARRSRSTRALSRDGGNCQVPGCSRVASHAHHIVFRSAGGGDDSSNLVSLCAAHHLRGVHEGHVRVTGQAPDALVWELGRGWDGAPLQVFDLRTRPTARAA